MIVAVAILVAQLAGDWLWGALGAIGLFISLSRFFLATRFSVDDDGVEAAYPLSKTRIKWSEVGWIAWRSHGVMLARNSSRRSRRRGVVLDLTPLEHSRAQQLRVIAQARTAPGAWQ